MALQLDTTASKFVQPGQDDDNINVDTAGDCPDDVGNFDDKLKPPLGSKSYHTW